MGEERNLFSVAYKNSTSVCRTALQAVKQTLKALEGDTRHREVDVQAVAGYKVKLEGELNTKCSEVLEILGTYLLPTVTSLDGRVFFMKLKGDYLRYLSEYTSGEALARHSKDAQTVYEAAMKDAEQALPAQNHIRLGVALNYSVFLFEVMGSFDDQARSTAKALARKAYEDAMAALDPNAPDYAETH